MRHARLVLALLLASVAAGVSAALLTLVLHEVQHLATGSAHEGFSLVPPPRRVPVAAGGAVLAALSWWALRSRGPIDGLGAVQKDPEKRLPFWRNVGDALTTILAVGCGMAVGRETAPRQVAAVAAEQLTWRLGVRAGARADLVAAAAAAGLAAVYNAPLAGIAYAGEVASQRWSWRVLGFGAVTCILGTVVGWPVVGNHPNLGAFPGRPADWWWGLPLGLLAAGLGIVYRALTAWSRAGERPAGLRLVLALGGVGLALGVATLWLPDLTGNGRAAILSIFGANPTVLVLVGLLLVKPLLTMGSLRSGAVGGVLAPALAFGACAGALVAHAVGRADLAPGLAVVTAGAVLSVTQQAPFFGPLLIWEMCHPDWTTTSALALSTAVAQGITRIPRRQSS